jgi:type I restriction enzyme R subunit
MSKPGEHKTVQSRILRYAQEIGWNFVSWEEPENGRILGMEISCLKSGTGMSHFF